MRLVATDLHLLGARPFNNRMRDLNQSGKALRELLGQRILVLDGAMGTMLQQANLSAEDFGGAALEGCNENLVRTRPDVVLDIHRKYFEAGADIVETNSFGGAPIVLAEYGLAADAPELNRLAAQLARQAADAASTPGKPRFVAGSMGPTTKAITVTGGVTFDELRQAYYVQAKGLGGGRVRPIAGRDLPGHPEHQGGFAGDRAAFAGDRRRGPDDRVGDDRGHGLDAGGAEH